MSDAKPKLARRACVYCDGRRWVDDENWSTTFFEPVERTPRDGLIPCGGCNFAGWDTPLAPAQSDNRRTS
ncbi:hypothetical protein [Methylobacterium sp. WL19]|uniref:hypothetical protein n=1 Tax=Methylobacterium sp. WL19 TaxID=2603896 RepID=UPI0011CAF3B0|nr:hypothetical protein [Methylobacterium sp. WL19]TXN27212.1 hypothetical protein FV220_12105 [Methylobacterium sp. WL19]